MQQKICFEKSDVVDKKSNASEISFRSSSKTCDQFLDSCAIANKNESLENNAQSAVKEISSSVPMMDVNDNETVAENENQIQKINDLKVDENENEVDDSSVYDYSNDDEIIENDEELHDVISLVVNTVN